MSTHVDAAAIEAGLAPLVGRALWASDRTGDLQTFQLGARRPRVRGPGDEPGETIEVGEYALHVQCGWRVLGPDGVVVGWRDLFVPAGPDPFADRPGWSWDTPGASRRDERLATWLRGGPYRVDAVSADPYGGCRLALAGGYTLDVLVVDTLPGEHWRLLRPGDDEPHLVVGADGLGT